MGHLSTVPQREEEPGSGFKSIGAQSPRIHYALGSSLVVAQPPFLIQTSLVLAGGGSRRTGLPGAEGQTLGRGQGTWKGEKDTHGVSRNSCISPSASHVGSADPGAANPGICHRPWSLPWGRGTTATICAIWPSGGRARPSAAVCELNKSPVGTT